MVEVNIVPEIREDVYPENDNKVQTDEPIGYQTPIPSELAHLELSWDRRKALMRIIIKDKGTWYFKEVLGKAQMLSSDNKTGRLNLKAIPFLDGETLYLYRDPESIPHKAVADNDVLEVLHPTNNRLCYNRNETCWRIRDERQPWADMESRRLVKNYVGDISIEWNHGDLIAHIFHKGEIVLDKNNVAHLYDLEISV